MNRRAFVEPGRGLVEPGFSLVVVRGFSLVRKLVEPGFSLVVVRGFSLVAALMIYMAPVVLAHEGHDHKVMGTVTKIQDTQLEVKAQDGKAVTVTLNDQTKILRGKQKTPKTDIKEGERVVVIYTTTKEKVSVAKEVRLAAQTTATP